MANFEIFILIQLISVRPGTLLLLLFIIYLLQLGLHPVAVVLP
jgi:hypothetical protein